MIYQTFGNGTYIIKYPDGVTLIIEKSAPQTNSFFLGDLLGTILFFIILLSIAYYIVKKHP